MGHVVVSYHLLPINTAKGKRHRKRRCGIYRHFATTIWEWDVVSPRQPSQSRLTGKHCPSLSALEETCPVKSGSLHEHQKWPDYSISVCSVVWHLNRIPLCLSHLLPWTQTMASRRAKELSMSLCKSAGKLCHKTLMRGVVPSSTTTSVAGYFGDCVSYLRHSGG